MLIKRIDNPSYALGMEIAWWSSFKSYFSTGVVNKLVIEPNYEVNNEYTPSKVYSVGNWSTAC
ncbi:hypothetical protein PPEP_a2528 [Pseudoalteromonas peptidolytica F12-50-A1]|uniref:Uncharacterized protein n=1 Tax=Pseudoalteromonas peptidolytica F12-50-A1 TaxID=1315280 RepID=A0A8I0T1T6_9GAMM|nr:hypothetical protein [Pseudoalteromonas peptidolytica F12-50-A1]GEK09030.1 hypothetical protein PPE03_12790 [Pseudoalteromonas peptidolytica]